MRSMVAASLKGHRNISTEQIFLSAAVSLLALPKTGVA